MVEQTSAEIDNTAAALRANDPPRDTSPPVNVNDSLGINAAPQSSASSALGMDDPKYDRVQHSLADMYRQHMAADDKTESGLVGTMQKSLKEQEARVEHMGVEAEKLKPWDEEQKSKEFHTDPVMAFGSLGSVFGILASAFTRTPMVNALNASAAAMDAIKAGDDKAYERAFKASDANYKMAIERHRIEMDAYNAHDGLLKTNIGLWREKQRVEAARFGDTKKLLMLDNGMDSEFMKIREADSKVATEMSKNRTEKLQADMEMARYMALVKENGGDMKDPTNPGNQKAYQQLQKEKADLKRSEHSYGSGASAALEERTKYYETDPNSPTYGDHFASQDRALAKIGEDKRKPPSPTEQAIALKKTEMEKEKGRPLTSAEYDKIVADAPKAQTVKPFTTPESARLTYTPTLVRSLQVLDSMMDDSTGLFTGSMKQFAGEYVGVNTPVQLWQSAHKQAEAAVTALAAQGSKSAISLKALIDTLPETPRSSAFGHQQVADKMQSLLDESQTALSTMEAGGKRIPEDVMNKFAKFGVTTKTDADKNPLTKLNKDPASLTDDELKNMAGLKMGYPKEAQDKIVAEIKRRAAEWEKMNPRQ